MASPVLAKVTLDSGRLTPSRKVNIYEQDGETLATIYALDGVTEVPNPITTDQSAILNFYVDPGIYFANPVDSPVNELFTVGEVTLPGPPTTYSIDKQLTLNLDIYCETIASITYIYEDFDDMFTIGIQPMLYSPDLFDTIGGITYILNIEELDIFDTIAI